MAKNKIADPLSAYHAAVHIHGMAGGVAAITRFLADVHAGSGTNIGSSVTKEMAGWLGRLVGRSGRGRSMVKPVLRSQHLSIVDSLGAFGSR